MVSILVGASKIMAMVSGVENCAAFVSIFLFFFFFFLRLESSTNMKSARLHEITRLLFTQRNVRYVYMF